MPKEVLKIEDFSGGLNTYSSQRDIEDNQLVKADNIDVSSVGILKSGPTMTNAFTFTDDTSVHNISGVPNPGNGIFQYSHDYSAPGGQNFRVNKNTGFDTASNWTLGSDMTIDTGASFSGMLVYAPSGAGNSTLTADKSAGHTNATAGYLRNSVTYAFDYVIRNVSDDSHFTSLTLVASGGINATDLVLTGDDIKEGHHIKTFTSASDMESADLDIKIKFTVSDAVTIECDKFYIYPSIIAQRANYIYILDASSTGTFDYYNPNSHTDVLPWENGATAPIGEGEDLAFGGSGTNPSATYSVADGNLRISDTNFSNNNLPLWRGYVDRALLGDSNSNPESDMGKRPGFYNYNSILAAPTNGDSASWFASGGGTPTMDGQGDQLGLSVNLETFDAVEMIAGLNPNSSANGLSNSAYDTSGNYGGGNANSGLSGGAGVYDAVDGVQSGTVDYTLGENIAEGGSSITGHDSDEGYYLYPKAYTEIDSDDVGASTSYSAPGGTIPAPSIMPFVMGNMAFRINWMNGDALEFEYKGFGQNAGTWSKSAYTNDDGDIYFQIAIIADDETQDDYNQVRSMVEAQHNNSDHTGYGAWWFGRKIPAAHASDGQWHLARFYTNYGIDAEGNDNHVYIHSQFPYNGDFNAYNDYIDHTSRARGVWASFTGIGKGFKLAVTALAEGITNSASGADDYSPTSNDECLQGLRTHDATNGAGSGAHIGFRNFRIKRGPLSQGSGEVGDLIGQYTFYYSWLYDEAKSESGLKRFNSDKVKIYKHSNFRFKVYAERDEQSNRRITGARIYFQKDEEVDKYMLCDVDMNKGTKKAGDVEYATWNSNSTWGNYKTNSDWIYFGGDEGKDFSSSYVTHQTNLGTTDDFVHYRWKSSTVINRRMYLGNIAKIDESGNIVETYGDRMVKSLANQYDAYPENNFIDVAVQDGDDITHLESYAERILQFKRNSLYIINVSGAVEFLEGQYAYLGVSHPTQVCKSELGVFWVNNKGLHLYDGQKIHDLTDGRISSEDFITDELNNVPSIIYNPVAKKLIISSRTKAGTGGTDYGDGWIFCLKTFSFVKLKGMFPNTTAAMTNFILTETGDVVYAVGTTWYKILDTPDNTVISSTNKEFEIQTKDYDFGDAAVLKKIHKIYVTYKMPTNDSEILIKGAKNGSNTFTDVSFTSVQNYHSVNGFEDSTGWATAIIKPSSSLSCYSLQLKIYASDKDASNIEKFEINDMSIIYRKKTVK